MPETSKPSGHLLYIVISSKSLMSHIPELLAPAGDMLSLKAAVENGADAVYLGVKKLSARAYASNFSLDELEQAIDYAHLRGVKVYITVNTLIKELNLLSRRT